MFSESSIYIFCLIDSTVLLFLAVFFIINLSDLESDYVNAALCCQRLNRFIVPEIVAQGLMTLLLLTTMNLLPIAINVPMTIWLFYRFMTVPKGRSGLYDPAEIHNRNELKNFTKEVLVKLGYHLLCFFLFLYCMITQLMTNTENSAAS